MYPQYNDSKKYIKNTVDDICVETFFSTVFRRTNQWNMALKDFSGNSEEYKLVIGQSFLEKVNVSSFNQGKAI
jgi:hypothetical protein